MDHMQGTAYDASYDTQRLQAKIDVLDEKLETALVGIVEIIKLLHQVKELEGKVAPIDY